MDPRMEMEEEPVVAMEAGTEKISQVASKAPETVTLESDSSEDEMNVVVSDDSPLSVNHHPQPQIPSRSGPSQKNLKQNVASKEPDIIDLTKDDEDDVMMINEPLGDSVLEDDSDMPELVEVEAIPATRVAEEFKKRGNEYFKVGDYYQALDMYTKAIQALPTDASYYGNRSACYMMLKKYKEALDDIRKSLRLDPLYSKGYLRLIRTTLALGNVTECEMAFSAAAKSGLDAGAGSERERLKWLKNHFTEIEATKVKKDYRKLVFLAAQGLEVATADNNLKMVKADALVRLGRHVEAQELCTEVLQNDMRCAEALYIRAMCLYLDDNLDKSIQFVRQGLQYAPDNSCFLLLFKKLKQVKELREEGSKKFAASRFDEAKAEYNRCLEFVSTGEMNNITIQSKLQFNLALIAQKLNQLDESLDACGKAIELNSGYLKAYIHRARVYVAKEMYDDAVHDFEAALKVDPTLKDLKRELQNAKLAAKRAKRKDYYKILQVDKKATEDEIRKAYKKRALLHHPDRHASAPDAVKKEQERLFKDLGEAYEVLSDTKKRFRYDQGVDLMDDRSYDSPGYDPSTADFFNVFFNSSAMPGFRPSPGATRGPHQQFHQHTFRH